MKNKVKTSLKYSIKNMDNIIVACLMNASNRQFITNIGTLYSMFSEESYKADYQKEVRVYLTLKIVDTINHNNKNTKESILEYIDLEGKYHDDCVSILESISDLELDQSTQESIESKVIQQIRYSVIENSSDKLMTAITNIRTANYENLDDEISAYRNIISNVDRDIRDARESLSNSIYDLDICEGGIDNIVSEMISDANNDTYKLKTGIRDLNELLQGGFEPERVYIFAGLPKNGKSIILFNVAMWIRLYNKNIRVKDPTKKPVVVYLSMENTVKETMSRMLTYVGGNGYNIKDKTVEDIQNILRQANLISSGDDGLAEIVIKYKANKSINTNGIIDIVEELAREGKECVAFIHDYAGRISPARSVKAGDIKNELGEVMNEFGAIAKLYGFPIISASQLNREAQKLIDSAETFNDNFKQASRVSSSHMGESIDILRNVDMVINLNMLKHRIPDGDGNVAHTDTYMMFNLVASRVGEPDAFTITTTRFVEGNSMRLVEDVNSDRSKSIRGSNGIIESTNQQISEIKTPTRTVGKSIKTNINTYQ